MAHRRGSQASNHGRRVEGYERCSSIGSRDGAAIEPDVRLEPHEPNHLGAACRLRSERLPLFRQCSSGSVWTALPATVLDEMEPGIELRGSNVGMKAQILLVVEVTRHTGRTWSHDGPLEKPRLGQLVRNVVRREVPKPHHDVQ